MANRLTTVWQHKHTALNPVRDALLGFVKVTKTLGAQLVAEGSAQWPRIGEFRFNRIDRTPAAIVEPPPPAPAPPPPAPAPEDTTPVA